MQTYFRNYLPFAYIAVPLCIVGSNAFGQPSELHKADSLFYSGRYEEARKLYSARFETNDVYNRNLLLKLAYLSERSKEPAQSLYYLSIIAQEEPSVDLLEKINRIANENNLEGYDYDDFNYLLVFYRRYGGYVPILLLTLGTYVVYVMVSKSLNGEAIQKRHKWAVLIYLMALLGLLNIPSSYNSGVVKSPVAYVRSFPSAASPVVETIRQGHKLVVIGKRDHWNRVIWGGRIVYVRSTDMWTI